MNTIKLQGELGEYLLAPVLQYCHVLERIAIYEPALLPGKPGDKLLPVMRVMAVEGPAMLPGQPGDKLVAVMICMAAEGPAILPGQPGEYLVPAMKGMAVEGPAMLPGQPGKYQAPVMTGYKKYCHKGSSYSSRLPEISHLKLIFIRLFNINFKYPNSINKLLPLNFFNGCIFLKLS